MKYYILFPNHYNGIRLDGILREKGIKTTLAPTPRELSHCCGISLIVNGEDIPTIKDIIKHKNIEILKITGAESLGNRDSCS